MVSDCISASRTCESQTVSPLSLSLSIKDYFISSLIVTGTPVENGGLR